MKLGILGGTFDPIHLGHLLIAEAAREELSLDKVLFVPAADPPHKQAVHKSAASHRQKMVELAIGDNHYFELSRVDIERSGPHYSVDTVERIRERYNVSADNCFFIIGGDSLADLPTWHHPQDLIQACRLAVVHRPGYQPDITDLEKEVPDLRNRLDWVTSPSIELSATEIRKRVAQGQTIRYQVPDAVEQYIAQQRLYQNNANFKEEPLFVVMNRISVNADYTEQFEERFRNRAGEVDKMEGFIRNQVLRPDNADDPYIVLTYWKSKADFEAWVNSEAFQRGHAKSGTLPPEAFKGRPRLERFEVILDSGEK